MMHPEGSVHSNPSILSTPTQSQPPLQLCPSRASCSVQFPCSRVFQVALAGCRGSHTAGQTLEAGGAPETERVFMGWVVGLERPQEGQQGPCTVVCRTQRKALESMHSGPQDQKKHRRLVGCMHGSQDKKGVMGKHQGPCMTRSTVVDQQHLCVVPSRTGGATGKW